MFLYTEDEAVALCRAYRTDGEAGALQALRQFTPFVTTQDEESALGWVRTSFAWEIRTHGAARQSTERAW